MRSPNLLALLFFLVAAIARADEAPKHALPSPLETTNTCESCHETLADGKLRAPATEYAHSTHRDERIGCVGCHKGDPQDPTVGAHRAAGFTPHPTHAEIPAICGGCHEDAAFMRVINGRIPVGQYALYQLSLHGKLTAAGDPDAPSCADCHGRHDIVPPSTPAAPVNRLNVAKVCAGCHADAKRMAKYPIPTDQFDKWQHSVHGEAFRKGNPNAPTCTGCHGAHAAVPPDTASVARACGRCPEPEMTLFEQSPHSKGFRQRGFAQCVVCHSNHDVAPATELLVGTSANATCMKCHAKDDKPREVAGAISDRLGVARQRAADAREAMRRADEKGLRAAGARYALEQLASAELELRAVVHTLDPARVSAKAEGVERKADEALRLVNDAERERADERRGYFVALVLAGLLFVLLGLRAVQLDRRRRSERP